MIATFPGEKITRAPHMMAAPPLHVSPTEKRYEQNRENSCHAETHPATGNSLSMSPEADVLAFSFASLGC